MSRAADPWADFPEPTQRAADPWADFPEPATEADPWADFPEPAGEGPFSRDSWAPTILATVGSMVPAAAAGGLASLVGSPALGLVAAGAVGDTSYRMIENALTGDPVMEDITPGTAAFGGAVGWAVPTGLRAAGRGIGRALASPETKRLAAEAAEKVAGAGDDLSLSQIIDPLYQQSKRNLQTIDELALAKLTPEEALIADTVPGARPEGWWRKFSHRPGNVDTAARFRTPYRALLNSPSKAARAMGENLWVRDNARSLMTRWGAIKKKQITAGLDATQMANLEKQFRPAMRGNIVTTELSPEVQDALERYGTASDELFDMKTMLGIMEKVDDTFEPVLYDPGHVRGVARPEVDAVLSPPVTPFGSMKEYIFGGAKQVDKEAKIMAGGGVSRDQAKIMLEKAGERGHGMIEYQRNLDLPESYFDQSFTRIWDRTILHEMEELGNALAGGGGIPSKLKHTMPDDTHREFDVPPAMTHLVSHLENIGRKPDAEMMKRVLHEIYNRKVGPEERKFAFYRQLSGNVALPMNFFTQAGEVSKGVAFSGGVKDWVAGLAHYYGREGKPVRDYAGAATGSALHQMMGDLAMSGVRKTSPIHAAQWMDSTARHVNLFAGRGMTLRVAKRGAKLLSQGKKLPAGLKKEAEEIMGMAPGTGEEALERLTESLRANGVLAPEVIILGDMNMTKRWQYNYGPGLIPDAISHGWGSVALQYKTFGWRAFGQYMDDVIKPMVDGAKLATTEGDFSLLRLGFGRFIRSYAYTVGPTTLSQWARALMSGREFEMNRVITHMASTNWGIPADVAVAIGRAALGDPRQIENMGDIPAVSIAAKNVGRAGRALGGDGSAAVELGFDVAKALVPEAGWLTGVVNKATEKER